MAIVKQIWRRPNKTRLTRDTDPTGFNRIEHDSRAISEISHRFEPATAVSFLDFLFPDFALAKSNPCDNLFFRSSIVLSKSCFPVSGGVAGVSPAEGVAEDSLLAEARGRLSPSTLLINFQLTHPIVSHHVIENQSIPHDKFRFRHTKALIHSL